MSNEVVVQLPGNISQKFGALATQDLADDLSGGMSGNYAIISIRGGKWRIKYQGAEQPILDKNGEPVPSLEAVIIKSNPFLTKQYFEGGYEEGESAAPICYSTDGKVPAANAPQPQHTNCALCPKNKFGSRVTDAGVEVKACQDNRKLAIVPLSDIKNELFGGPMLFRIPASALKNLQTFGTQMKARGYPYNAVAVRIGFDVEVSYPKPTFKAMRVLTDDEAEKVIEMYKSAAVENVLGGEAVAAAEAKPAAAAPVTVADPDFEEAPVAQAPAQAAPAQPTPAAAAPKPAARKTAKPQPEAPKPAPVQQAVPAAETAPPASGGGGGLDADIASILAELNNQ